MANCECENTARTISFRVKAGGWEVVDDLVDDFLGKRIHDA